MRMTSGNEHRHVAGPPRTSSSGPPRHHRDLRTRCRQTSAHVVVGPPCTLSSGPPCMSSSKVPAHRRGTSPYRRQDIVIGTSAHVVVRTSVHVVVGTSVHVVVRTSASSMGPPRTSSSDLRAPRRDRLGTSPRPPAPLATPSPQIGCAASWHRCRRVAVDVGKELEHHSVHVGDSIGDVMKVMGWA